MAAQLPFHTCFRLLVPLLLELSATAMFPSLFDDQRVEACSASSGMPETPQLVRKVSSAPWGAPATAQLRQVCNFIQSHIRIQVPAIARRENLHTKYYMDERGNSMNRAAHCLTLRWSGITSGHAGLRPTASFSSWSGF